MKQPVPVSFPAPSFDLLLPGYSAVNVWVRLVVNQVISIIPPGKRSWLSPAFVMLYDPLFQVVGNTCVQHGLKRIGKKVHVVGVSGHEVK